MRRIVNWKVATLLPQLAVMVTVPAALAVMTHLWLSALAGATVARFVLLENQYTVVSVPSSAVTVAKRMSANSLASLPMITVSALLFSVSSVTWGPVSLSSSTSFVSETALPSRYPVAVYSTAPVRVVVASRITVRVTLRLAERA